MLMRSFRELTTFGAEGTALKIIQGIAASVAEFKDRSFYGCYQQHSDVSSIEDLSNLKKALKEALLFAIDYPSYQRLSKDKKDEIKKLLRESLFNDSDQYQYVSKHVVFSLGRPEEKLIKGVNFIYRERSCSNHHDRRDVMEIEPYKIVFPKDLFLNHDNLVNSIVKALKEKYINILRVGTHDPDLKTMQIAQASHMLFQASKQQTLFSKLPPSINHTIAALTSDKNTISVNDKEFKLASKCFRKPGA